MTGGGGRCPTVARSRSSDSGCGRCRTAPTVRTRCGGRSSSATGTSTPPRPTATRRASAALCARAGCRARRSSSPPSSTRAARTRSPRRSRASSGSASTRSTSTSSTGRRAARRGRGPGWRRRGSAVTPARSASPTSASGARRRSSAWRPPRPVVNQVQFSPFEYRRELLEAAASHGVALEAYSPLGPAATSPTRRCGEIAERVGPDPGAGAAALVPAARPDRAAQVHPPGAHRGQRGRSTSRSPTTTWRGSTRSTRPAAPTRRASATGGEPPA